MKMKNTRILSNTIMLMIFNLAKIIFPFITLPYLTRVLSTDTYGVVTYAKTVMNYMQIFVDFGFVLSATKDIVKCRDNKEKMELVIGDTMIARIILGLSGFLIVLLLSLVLPILRTNILYTMLSYVAVFLSIFLMDFLFRGLEKMHVITIRFIVMKVISTILTFVLIKNDSHLLLIPILDIVSTAIAIILVFIEVKKLQLKMRFSALKNALITIKDSFTYFLSNAAATSFNALNTIIIGIYMTTTEVAYWGICIQIIGTIQACYSPISDGIYPEMIKNKSLNLIKKVIKIILPIVTLGCIISYFLAGPVLLMLGGEEYLKAVPTFIILIPTLFFGFLSIIFGWPTLGAIEKTKQVTISTVTGVTTNIVLLFILILMNKFTLINVAIVRNLTEMTLFIIRFYFVRKYRKLFCIEEN